MTAVITETQRNELRKRAARWMARQPRRTIEVPAAHLLDLLDCADRCAELEEQHTCRFCGSPRMWHTCACNHVRYGVKL